MTDFLNQLNDAQREAVSNTQGPALVIAGAGAGKTRVLTCRIAWLLINGISATNILALTFTNKAAKEMKERISTLVGNQHARYLTMGTFHSVFSKILRQEATRIGYSAKYTIYDATDSKNLIKHIIQDMQLDDKQYKPAVVAARISMAKNRLFSPADYAADRTFQQEDRYARLYRLPEIYAAYNSRLRQADAMDFDDLLFNMNLMLEQYPDIRDKYREVFRYIFVDEYQDTNLCQSRIVSTLAYPQNNICVVGDDAQSIYSFRGADIDNILRFNQLFDNTRIFKLERNYRSTQNIVDAANSLIQKNRNQIQKSVYSEKEKGEPLMLSVHDNDRLEAEFIALTIRNKALQAQRLQALKQPPYNHFAVLYRTNSQSRVIEDELRKLSVPYRIYGGLSFYQRKEIKDAIAYFRLIVNHNDDEALLRVINFPARGIGSTTLNRVLMAARLAQVPAFNVVSAPQQYALDCSPAICRRLTDFAQLIQSFSILAEQEDAFTFARQVLKQTAVLTAAMADTTAEGKERYDNLQELLAGIHEFRQNRDLQAEPAFITDFLAEVSLLTDQDQPDDDTPRVSLMTIHAAKGLEFPVVIIAGLEENLFPSAFAQTEREIEEERRLLYVAITRAGRQCMLTYARQRFRNGQLTFSNPSRFIQDIDNRYIRRPDAPTHSFRTPSWLNRDFSADAGSTSQADTTLLSRKKLTKTTGSRQKTDRQPISSPFPIGSRVSHATFGVGTVIDAFEENDNRKILIRFDQSGEKTLLLKFAKLTPC